MISSVELKKQPRIFKSFTGVTVEEFKGLESQAEPLWLERERLRLARPNRQRAVGVSIISETVSSPKIV